MIAFITKKSAPKWLQLVFIKLINFLVIKYFPIFTHLFYFLHILFYIVHQFLEWAIAYT